MYILRASLREGKAQRRRRTNYLCSYYLLSDLNYMVIRIMNWFSFLRSRSERRKKLKFCGVSRVRTDRPEPVSNQRPVTLFYDMCSDVILIYALFFCFIMYSEHIFASETIEILFTRICKSHWPNYVKYVCVLCFLHYVYSLFLH